MSANYIYSVAFEFCFVFFLYQNQLNMLPLNNKLPVNKMKRSWEYCVVVVTLKLYLQVWNNQVRVIEFYKPTEKLLHSIIKVFSKTKNSEKKRRVVSKLMCLWGHTKVVFVIFFMSFAKVQDKITPKTSVFTMFLKSGD